MATISKITSAPTARLDAEGRMLPLTDAEQSQYALAFQEGMARLAAVPDEPGEDDREFFRAMDADRPERPLFQGMY